MDALDREIFEILQDDGRITATDLAARIQLSLSATSERLRQLSSSGAIKKFTVVVDPEAVGRPIEALIDVRLGPSANDNGQAALDEAVAELPWVVDAVHLTGRFDTQLRVATADVAELDELLVQIKDRLGAEETNTRLVLRTIESFPRSVMPRAR